MKIKAKKLLPYIGWPLFGIGGFILFSAALNQQAKPWIGWVVLIVGLLLLAVSTKPEKEVSEPKNFIPEDKDNVLRNRKIY